MYEQFGAAEVGNTGVAEFRLFLPDASMDAAQYVSGGVPRITRVRAVGTFQDQPWDVGGGLVLTPQPFQGKGQLYSARMPAPLRAGFYEYKYYVEFETASPRWVGDLCAKYGGTANQNAGFVIDLRDDLVVRPIRGGRRALKDLVLYELMLDDLTAGFRGARAPLDAVADKVDYLARLGVNAVELMPWTAWPSDGFNWGYEPYAYFSVAHRLTLDPQDPTNKLVFLKRFINVCHDRGIAVLMDGVFNHAQKEPGTNGFAYYHLYQDSADSPYVGDFQDHDFATDLDYANGCTLDFIFDVCAYWIDVFKIDGIRFDNTMGFYKADDRSVGLPKLLARLRDHLASPPAGAAIEGVNFDYTLEHSWDYAAIDVANKVGATSCWYDPCRSSARSMLSDRRVDRSVMRMLNASRDFAPGRLGTAYLENHDHATLMVHAGSRDEWWRTQPWMIALFTMPAAPLLHNGQEWGAMAWFPEMGLEEQQFPAVPRVAPRPLDWAQSGDAVGLALAARYRTLAALRNDHPGLREPGFYPAEWQSGELDADGFGVDEARQVVVYHRFGSAGDGTTEYFIVALNCATGDQEATLSFPHDGTWQDLLDGGTIDVVANRYGVVIPSNWGRVYWSHR